MNLAALRSFAVLVGLQIPGADGLGGPLTQILSHRFIDLTVMCIPRKALLAWGEGVHWEEGK